MKSNLSKNLKKKKGFTLIELIIVIAVLGILAAIAIPKYAGMQAEARKKADITSAKTIAQTAQVLITQEKINVGTADATTSTAIGGYGDDLSLSAAGGSGYLIGKSLQNIPKPQASGSAFTVDIDKTTGEVKVKVGTSEIYPTPEGDWE